ncbi:MAG: pseudouridine synthase family protein [Bacteroidetes bacterium]|jgi:23S rRNA pseudouridine2605 synthase|nr:pseudouridine synthase family protein [Bacteroidota bacterium]
MSNKSGGPGKSFGKRGDSGESKKTFGKGRGEKSFGDKEKSFSKKEEGSSSDEAKPKKRVFTSADFGGEAKKTSRSNSYSKGFDGGDEKKPRKEYGTKKEGDSYDDKPRKDYGDKKPYAKKEGDSSYSDRPRKDYGDKKSFGDKKPYAKRDGDSSYGDKPKRDYGDKKSFGDKKPYAKRDGDSSYGDKPKRDYGDKSRKDYGDKKPFGDKKPYAKRDGDSSYGDKPRKDYGDKPRKEYGESKSFGDRKPYPKRDTDSSYGDKPRKDFGDKRPISKGGSGSYSKKSSGDGFDASQYEAKPRKDYDDKKPYGSDATDKKHRVSKRNFVDKEEGEERSFDKKGKKDLDGKRPRIPKKSFSKSNPANDGLIRLNKYISNSGVCSRREADKLIESGAVTVNGKIVSELGFKVSPDDVISYGGQSIRREKKVYVLLNKPKDYITTLDDPEGRKTVMELLKNTGKERIYPVGRLDRNTTGLLMLTNDGDMAMKLTHPKHNIQKMYSVDIDKGIKPEDLKALKDGFELEDGFIKADKVEIVGEGTSRKEIGIEIHSGRNRIVRRMFEHLGYSVVRLDRVMFAGLTKKDLPRGKWRFLSDKEISFLKMI